MTHQISLDREKERERERVRNLRDLVERMRNRRYIVWEINNWETERGRERQKERETEREGDRKRERQKERETERYKTREWKILKRGKDIFNTYF